MSAEKGNRGQQEQHDIQNSITAHEGDGRENPFGFSERDRVGQWKDFGSLYKKGDRFGFQADSGEPDEPIVAIDQIAHESILTSEEHLALRYSTTIDGVQYVVGNERGRLFVVQIDDWGMKRD